MKTTPRQRAALRLIVVALVILIGQIFWLRTAENGRIQIAVAKGKQMLDMGAKPDHLFSPEQLTAVIPQLNAIQEKENVQFVEAVRLGQSESQQWHCEAECAHAIYYDMTNGGTINAIVNLKTKSVEAEWTDALARPPGSQYILDRTMEIAAADPQVQAILGDIGAANPVMIPMSGWLSDNACRDDWCVDLTFASPAGDGRVLHIFVNLEQGQVARTFYTRGRPDLDVEMPVLQRSAYDDGCAEQDGWSVCWEMTAHDGLNFTDAAYDDTLIFSSAKITQIEAWYPSWPGGYRDEIGFNATVRPYGDTELNEFDDGFEVRQLFTEFTRWPNCICCYRYEQIIRFYDNGALDFRFTSHGPGCDDLSIYRPFWRIDVDLDGPNNHEVQIWDGAQWVEAETELELHPFVETSLLEENELLEVENVVNLSLTGSKVAANHNDTGYIWQMEPTDPLGHDEAYFFILQDNENEGDGPVVTGPGDTYQPPRQWINGDPVSGEDIVFWFVPLLKTKQSEPLWCMPDPEPGINQCEAILRAIPGGPKDQITLAPTPAATPPPTPSPPPALTPSPTPTPRPIEGETVEEVILNAGCGACHVIGALGEARKVGPDLTNIGAVAGERIAGVSAADYLRQSILEPNAFIAPECPNGPCLTNVMPQYYGERLSPEQVEMIVAYLLELGDTAVPEPDPAPDNPSTPPDPLPKTNAAGKGAVQPPPRLSPIFALSLVMLLVLLALALFWVRKQPNE
ncbi:MAG: c-type cytochrome [Chloroflexi bacterium]|nr:c-type cytochrome [Chloroflexota bacterium]